MRPPEPALLRDRLWAPAILAMPMTVRAGHLGMITSLDGTRQVAVSALSAQSPCCHCEREQSSLRHGRGGSLGWRAYGWGTASLGSEGGSRRSSTHPCCRRFGSRARWGSRRASAALRPCCCR